MQTRVGAMVATLARAQGLTVKTLSERTGLHRNRLADKIAGRQSFTETDILLLAEHLNVDPARLFEDPLELLGIRTGGDSFKEPACVTAVDQVAAVAA